MPSTTFPTTIPTPVPQKPTLRPAIPSDAPAIAHLGATIFSTTFGYSLPPSDLAAFLEDAYSPTAILSTLTNPAISTLVAISPTTPHEIVGFVQLNRSSTEPCIEQQAYAKPVELQRLYVSPTFHGAGTGKMLVDGIERIAQSEGYKTLWLGVWEENAKAKRFYQKCGLGKCGEHDFTMGTCVQTDWIMKKDI